MSAFKMNGQLTNSRTMTAALYANQHETRATDADDTEILYYNNGAPTSSAGLTFDGSAVNVTGSVNTTANVNASADMTIGYKGALGTDHGIRITASDPTAVYMDVHTLAGNQNNFDYRMIFGGGTTGQNAGGSVNFEGKESNFYTPLRTIPKGQPSPPPFYIDYGTIIPTTGVNEFTQVTYHTIFPEVPHVFCSLWDITGSGADDQTDATPYVTQPTGAGFRLQMYGGTRPVTSATRVWYLALGGTQTEF